MQDNALIRLVKENAKKILELGEKHGAENIRIFGSVARGDTREESDIDFLIDKGPKEKWSAWFPVSLANELEDLLGKEVDVAIATNLKARLRERILSEAVPVCEMIMND